MKNKGFVFKRTILFAALFAFSISMIAFFGYSGSSPDPKKAVPKIERIRLAGKLIVGTSADYPPFEFHILDDKEGEIVGIDIDIANVIAKELNVKMEVKNTVFHKLFSLLINDQVDIIIAGLTPSEGRKKIVDFSEVYYQAIQNLLIRAEDAEEIQIVNDLRGKTVGTQKGSMQEDMVRKHIEGAKFAVKDTIDELVEELKAKKIDAVILEKPVAKSIVFRNKELKSVECSSSVFGTMLGSAIAVKRGNKKLLKEINRILRELKKENKIEEFIQEAKIMMNKK